VVEVKGAEGRGLSPISVFNPKPSPPQSLAPPHESLK